MVTGRRGRAGRCRLRPVGDVLDQGACVALFNQKTEEEKQQERLAKEQERLAREAESRAREVEGVYLFRRDA